MGAPINLGSVSTTKGPGYVAGDNSSLIELNQPASVDCIVTQISARNPRPNNDAYAVRGGSFYNTSGNIWKCRDAVLLGFIARNSVGTFYSLTLNFKAGDRLGAYLQNDERLDVNVDGIGYMWVGGNHCIINDAVSYNLVASPSSLRLCGLGTPIETAKTFIRLGSSIPAICISL